MYPVIRYQLKPNVHFMCGIFAKFRFNTNYGEIEDFSQTRKNENMIILAINIKYFRYPGVGINRW